MRAANQLKKENPVILRGASLTQSQALHYAWWFEDFRGKLRTGVFRFSYFKEDGSIREAVGTLNLDYIPEDKRPKGTRKGKVNYATFPYYDLDRCAWRSFDIRNFIGFVSSVS